MKKWLGIVAIFICGLAHSQSGIYVPVNPSTYGSNNLRIKATQALNLPSKPTLQINTTDTTPQIFYHWADSSIWAWSRDKGYFKVGNGNGGGGGTSITASNSGTVSQLRSMTTTTGYVYFSTDFGGGQWTDIGVKADDDFRVDDGATLLLTSNNHFLQRQITGDVYVTWFRAIANDTNNDLPAFNAAVAFCKTLNGTPRLHIPGGRYRLNGRWIVDGFAWTDNFGYSAWTGIKIVGDGSQSTILDFSASTTGGLQYGSGATNTLNSGIEDISIIGNQNIDGLTLVSTAPYTCTINRFTNLYITDVRDGIVDSTGISFTSSDHANVFVSPKVERYWRYGVHTLGVYCSFTGVPFIVHPMGSGASTLALLAEGQHNDFGSFTCEDQIYLKGYENKIPHLALEKVIKTVGYSGFFGQVIQIDGVNNIISGKVNDVDNSFINTILYITGANIKISDFQYRNEESDPNHVIANPAILENVSNGVMENVVFNTTNKMDKEGYYEKSMLNWDLIHVEGENGYISKKSKEILVEAPPSGTWPAGIKAINKTLLPNEPEYWTRTIVGPDSSWVSSINSLDQIASSGNATSRILISAGMYAPDHHLNGNSVNDIGGYFTTSGSSAVVQATNFAGTGGAPLALNKFGGKVGIGKDPGVDSLDVEGTGKFSGNITTVDAVDSLNTPTYRQLIRNINSIPIQWGVVGSDIRNITGTRVDVTGLTLSTDDVFFVDNAKAVMMKSASHGMLLKGATGAQNDYAVATPAGQLIIYNPTGSNNLIIGNLNGTVTVPTTVSASRAAQPTDLLRKDQLDSAYVASGFGVRNAGGIGDTLMNASKEANTLIYKRLAIYSNNATKTVDDTTITYQLNDPISGTSTIVGDGSTTSFTIPLSITGLSVDSRVWVTPRTALGTGVAVSWVDVSGTSMTVYFTSAPSSGTKTINYMIQTIVTSP